ncbi:MAG: hypothetical protein WC547_09600 [Candidatus Omnitrophota bacterium]
MFKDFFAKLMAELKPEKVVITAIVVLGILFLLNVAAKYNSTAASIKANTVG